LFLILGFAATKRPSEAQAGKKRKSAKMEKADFKKVFKMAAQQRKQQPQSLPGQSSGSKQKRPRVETTPSPGPERAVITTPGSGERPPRSSGRQASTLEVSPVVVSSGQSTPAVPSTSRPPARKQLPSHQEIVDRTREFMVGLLGRNPEADDRTTLNVFQAMACFTTDMDSLTALGPNQLGSEEVYHQLRVSLQILISLPLSPAYSYIGFP
jgi:hypothetical protein